MPPSKLWLDDYFLKHLTLSQSSKKLRICVNTVHQKSSAPLSNFEQLWNLETFPAWSSFLFKARPNFTVDTSSVRKTFDSKLKKTNNVLSNYYVALPESTFKKILRTIVIDQCSHELVLTIGESNKKLAEIAIRGLEQPDQPLVSVIMPTYNRANIIGDSIATIVDQGYENWELLVCDDASTDNTHEVVTSFKDTRIHYIKLDKGGAAAARNIGLERARGTFIAYLDSDNYWHPEFLMAMVTTLLDHPGRSSIYADFIDFHVNTNGEYSIKSFVRPQFDHESLLKKPFIDLNSFVHHRELYDCFGGFNKNLTRRQDYDLILKYTWLRDPLHFPYLLTLYHRNDSLNQITTTRKHDNSCVSIINNSLETYFKSGLPLNKKKPVRKVTILIWDLCRNHFSKPFALAEALSVDYEVQIISFRFFEEEIFPPLKGVNPSFETVYLPGTKFPSFFEAMEKAVTAIRGEVIYVVKPRLPSLGIALLANYKRMIPVILEINDLETVVSSPMREDRHMEVAIESVDLSDRNLLNPYSDLWSQLMDPLAKTLPVLVTHNKNIDAHFGNRCLYMRNLKDELVYNPDVYERDGVRAELGFGPDDRVILFGGLIRKHKGIYELVELVKRLSDPRYKLLFVGSRMTPDQKKLKEKYGDKIRVLPPQHREAMARINLAADIVILWLDPEVAASHYQMPYKATDAFAMGTSIIANDISDLGDLAKQGYLRIAPFGDWDRMTAVFHDIFDNAKKTAAMRAAGRRLFLRQFSYAAARSNFELAARRALATSSCVLPAADTFARRFNDFYRQVKGVRDSFITGVTREDCSNFPVVQKVQGYGEACEDVYILIVDVKDIGRLTYSDPEGVAVVMPSINTAKALQTSRLLVKRAGMKIKVFVVEDSIRQGFIKTLNDMAMRINVKFVIYLAEDAFPGIDWVKTAYTRLEETGKGLLAFNCGKWKGRIAAFGMVRKEWVRSLYGGPILFPGYKAHKADNELTVIARVTENYVYEPDSVLVEIDAEKIFKENVPEDKMIFRKRFCTGFGGLSSVEKLKPLSTEYFVTMDSKEPAFNPFPKTKTSDKKTDLIEDADKTDALNHQKKGPVHFFHKSLSTSTVNALKREYLQKRLDKERDSFVLYRIIGNDLDPRHKKGQSQENLRFILENEKPFEACEKRFIVNRIINPDEERSIVNLLNSFKVEYAAIPFEREMYRQLGFDLETLNPPQLLFGPRIEKFDKVKHQRLQLALYRLKNNYVMNNNGARNFALRDGRARAKWILPFDGNCFITSAAWEQMRVNVTAYPYLKYFVVPMTRVMSNKDLMSDAFVPEPIEEPQIVFRKDAVETFNESFSYGRRPKVELFWRLQISGKWDNYKDDVWDQKRLPVSPEAGQFGVAVMGRATLLRNGALGSAG